MLFIIIEFNAFNMFMQLSIDLCSSIGKSTYFESSVFRSVQREKFKLLNFSLRCTFI